MITAIVTGATLVVTIGQLVLTQENGPLGDQQERMNSTLAVRDSVAELTGSPAPTDPAEFLDALLGAASRRARGLRESVRKHHADSPNAPLWDDVDDLTAGVVENADTVRDRLDGAEFGSSTWCSPPSILITVGRSAGSSASPTITTKPSPTAASATCSWS